ncbi:MAG: Xaa-Pro dipeptidase [Firmicutes bacterium HGW-Firmicutes-13]|nr:MAG: Xaa-Pro dipeptidase [Firmicutes bacterium HGW-Firmicutes-13]
MEADFINQRLYNLRTRLHEKELEGILISNPINCSYLSGFTGTSVYLLIMTEEAYLITDFRYLDQAVEEAPLFSLISLKNTFTSTVEEIVKKKRLKKMGFEQNHLTVYWYETLKKILGDVELVPLYQEVETLRAVKDEGEIRLIKEAAEIAEKSFEKILNYLKPGVMEEDIANELEYILKKEGGQKAAFDFIVASGKRSSLPHGAASKKKVEPGDIVVLDFGIYYNGYCSDITRTVAINYAGERERRLYKLVLSAQKEAIQGIKEGLTGEEADALARQVITKAGYGENFGHGLGHGVGLEVHEEPRLSANTKSILKQGMVVTIEPGVYFSGWGGIRIEDMVVIRESKCELLTQKLKDEFIVL